MPRADHQAIGNEYASCSPGTRTKGLAGWTDILGVPARGKTCPAIDGILEEGSEILDEYKGSQSLDAGLVGAAQAVEHYEIARYGTLVAWAKSLGKDDIVDLLNATLEEEEATDEALTALGEGGVNDRAVAEAA